MPAIATACCGERAQVRLGVALGGHVHPWKTLLSLVREAEALGYEAAFVDGDISMLPSRPESEVLDGWSTTLALLARTERIAVVSIRLVAHWNAAHLAQALATADRVAPGRVRLFISIGGQAADARFGLPALPASERIAWLDETLTAVRALWRGQTVRCDGRFVRLAGARLHPVPAPGRIPVVVAGHGSKLLDVVAAHADAWDVNLPPVRARVEAAAAELAAACRARGRDPGGLERSLWIFTRLSGPADQPALRREFRSLNPWFRDVPDAELEEALVTGSPEHCRRRLEEIRRTLGIGLPVLDLTGLDAASTQRVMRALAPKTDSLTR